VLGWKTRLGTLFLAGGYALEIIVAGSDISA
jgi:hypothetical protein